MKKTKAYVFVLLLALQLFFFGCKYDYLITPSSNIILHDKSLDVIRVNVQGKWKLLYAQGGLSWGTYPAKYNAFMDIAGDHIVAGNDSLGVTVDTSIVWKKELYNPPSEYTYLMGTPGPPGYPGGLIYKVVDRIKNDTLIIIDDAFDGYYYYYLKTKQP
ncbi:MAG: hypothetical protein JST48_12740 [Bacteroidetes bacterium]|nr:hypothetical protein [Bacteroidota bacterium]